MRVSLTEFLTARIDEDEEDARAGLDSPTLANAQDITWDWHVRYRPAGRTHKVPNTSIYYDHSGLANPQRRLAECEAKRRIVDEVELANGAAALRLFRILALPYADHPDFDPEWRL